MSSTRQSVDTLTWRRVNASTCRCVDAAMTSSPTYRPVDVANALLTALLPIARCLEMRDERTGKVYDVEIKSIASQFTPSALGFRVARNGALSDDRIGAWHLLTLTLSTSPYSSPRRASRVPKLLPFMFFPRTNYSLWVDGKLKLLVDPTSLIKRFLKQPRASLALPRNLRRDHIDEEVHWIRAALATEPSNQQPKSNPSGKQGKTGHTAKAAKLVAADAKAVDLQWAFYEAEQRNWSAGGSAGRNGGSGAASWTGATACAEGAMILANLQSALTRCVLCSWFNEWHRFGERDQLSLSYVLHAMRLTPPPEPPGLLDLEPSSERRPRGRAKHEKAHRGVYLWPRYDHWHHKPSGIESPLV